MSLENGGSSASPVRFGAFGSGLSGKRRVAIAVFLLGVVALCMYALVQGPMESKYKKVCSEEMINEASRALKAVGPDRIERIKLVTNTIVKQQNYRKDPNCIYPILEQRIAEGDYATANDLATQLESVFDGGFSEKYETDLKAIQEKAAYVEKVQNQTGQSVQSIYPSNREKGSR